MANSAPGVESLGRGGSKRHHCPGDRRATYVAAGWDAHIAFALAYRGLYPAMYPTPDPLPGQVERSGALLRAGFDELGQAGALRPGITAELATNALRAALRGVAHAVAANPGNGDNHAMSAVVRDALIHALVADRAHN